jgi:hypothetical protein
VFAGVDDHLRLVDHDRPGSRKSARRCSVIRRRGCADDKIGAVEDGELVDRVELQLVQCRDRRRPGGEDCLREAEGGEVAISSVAGAWSFSGNAA